MAKCVNIPMNVLGNINALMVQRCKRCTSDSPGLTSESEVYPGLMYVVWGTTPSVLRFLSAIQHKRFHYKRAFKEKAQHLRR